MHDMLLRAHMYEHIHASTANIRRTHTVVQATHSERYPDILVKDTLVKDTLVMDISVKGHFCNWTFRYLYISVIGHFGNIHFGHRASW